jgi:hypothetical protein
MSGNPRKAFLVSAVLVAGSLLMTACQDSDSKAAQGSSTAPPAGQAPAATPPPTGTAGNPSAANTSSGKDSSGKDSAGKSSGGQGSAAGAGAAAAGSSGAGAAGNDTIGKCRTADLKITANDTTIDGDPDASVAVTLHNIGHNCTMSGFAGVDLETNQGPLSATRIGEAAAPFTLKSDESVSFAITYPVNNTGGSGVRITGLLVTPPGETQTATLPWPGAATLPATNTPGTPVKVGPIGSAGQGN